MLRIIAGRGAARAGIQLSVLVLLPVWGADEFGRYVVAVGTFTWLVLLVMGVEKAALTILPRTRVLARRYTRMLLGRAAAPLILAAAATALLAPAGGTAALFAAAAAWAAGQGLLSVLASTHRLAGHPGRESAAFFALAAWVAVATGLAAAGVLRPYAYLLALIAGVLAVCAVLALLVPALWQRGRPRGGARVGPLVTRRVLLLGLSDVADAASGSVLYAVIAVAGRPADGAALYVAIVVSSALGGLGVLVLRLRQPVTSLRLRGLGGAAGRESAGRIAGWAAAFTAAAAGMALVGVLAAYALSGADGVAAVGSSALALAAVLAVEMTAFSAVLYAVYLLENTNGAALRLTSSAALAGLGATAVAAVAAVPALHAVGAMLALVVGLAAKAGLLHARLAAHTIGSATANWSTGRAP